MAGFVALFEAGTSPQEREGDFHDLLKATARFKRLEIPDEQAVGSSCTAAKLDARSSAHRGIVRDEKSGSWLMAAGTVVALTGNNNPDTLLASLLQDYIDNGTDALQRYDGQFALAIYHAREETLSVISDSMGCFAVYYARQGRKTFISTSALAIARQVRSKLDELTIECFLRTGGLYGGKTLWQDVKQVRPATVINIDQGKIQEFEYWTPEIDSHISHLSMNDAIELADEKICRIFWRSLSREGIVWADLTGGNDTRLTTMYMAKIGIPFIAYCVGPDGHPDVEVSRQVSKEMGWNYRHMPLPDCWTDEQSIWFDTAIGKGDGHLNVFSLTGVLQGGQERSLTSFVSVSGGGADEWRYHIFGANILRFNAVSSINYDNILDAKIIGNIPVMAMRHDHTIEVRNALKDHLTRSVARYIDSPKITQIDIAFLRYRHPIHSGAYMSAQAGIMRPIIPFCFKELENFGLSINHQWRIKNEFRFVRNLFERGNPHLANIPTETGAPLIPIRLTNLYRFGPLSVYLADHFVGKFSNKLLGKRLSLHAPQNYPAYPMKGWVTARLRWAIAEGLLNPEKMLSGELYNPLTLVEVAAQGLAVNYTTSEFLERVITVEMALRSAGSSLN